MKHTVCMESSELTVQSILPLIKYHFIGHATRHFSLPVTQFEYLTTATTARRGVSGEVLISRVEYQTEHGTNAATIALKFFQDKSSALREIKNAMELDFKFKTAPEFGIPRVIFASTQTPILIVYEGINGTNYDELEIPLIAEEAGRLLATIHGVNIRPVDTELYKNLIRMLGSQFASIGKEVEVSNALSYHFEKIQGAQSGCDAFSDFHQSNVMVSHFDDQISKAYVIDPEFMQHGSFDRMEDVGTFFGFQFYQEYESTFNVTQALSDLNEFLAGYNRKSKELGGYSLKEIYPRGNPVGFFIAQWALMDGLDIAVNRGGSLQSPEVLSRINFVLFLLQNVQFDFPTT